MRHLVAGRKLNRTSSHRRAMFSNMAVSILDNERITTTLAKAKEVRSVVERLITYAKRGNLHSIRLAERRIKNKTLLKKLFEDIGPSYKEREGGYTRIIKMNERKGDNAPMAIIELTGRSSSDPVRKKKKKAKVKKIAPKIVQQEKESTSDAIKDTVKESNEPEKKTEKE